MNCPVCVETALVMSERQGVEIDYCPRCRGVWLDRGELDKIIERSGNTFVNEAKADQRNTSRGHSKEGKDFERAVSQRPSAKQYYDDLDDYEYVYEEPRDNDYNDRERYENRKYDKRYYKKRKKPKSVLEEIFDIFD